MCKDVSGFSEAAGFYYCYQYVPELISNAADWTPDNFSAQYCMSEPVRGTCAFSMNLIIILLVIICNLGKALCMAFVGFSKISNSLITMGDGVASFLRQPDPHTKGMCTATKKDIVRTARHRTWGVPLYSNEWRPESKRWFVAASKTRWWTFIVL